jgi:hypothetical protein
VRRRPLMAPHQMEDSCKPLKVSHRRLHCIYFLFSLFILATFGLSYEQAKKNSMVVYKGGFKNEKDPLAWVTATETGTVAIIPHSNTVKKARIEDEGKHQQPQYQEWNETVVTRPLPVIFLVIVRAHQ